MAYEKNFRHIDPDEFHDRELTLHDCVANKVSLENSTLRFYLADGFWITPLHKENSSEKTVRTDASVVEFSFENTDEITVCVFTKARFSKKTYVEYWDIDRLITEINSGKCTLEFITQYRSFYEQMWHCVINSDKKPYFRECRLYLPQAKADFFWNELRTDREW